MHATLYYSCRELGHRGQCYEYVLHKIVRHKDSCFMSYAHTHTHMHYAALDLSHNQLSSLPDDLSLFHLLNLNLSSNLFQTFPPALRLMPALVTVDLSSNRLAEVHAEDLTSVPNLESVDLRGNPLRPEVKVLLQSMVRVMKIRRKNNEYN